MENLTTVRKKVHVQLNGTQTTEFASLKPVSLTVGSVIKFLCIVAAVLIAIHVYLMVNEKILHFENPFINTINKYFNLGQEMTVPTFFFPASVFMFLIISLYLFFN